MTRQLCTESVRKMYLPHSYWHTHTSRKIHVPFENLDSLFTGHSLETQRVGRHHLDQSFPCLAIHRSETDWRLHLSGKQRRGQRVQPGNLSQCQMWVHAQKWLLYSFPGFFLQRGCEDGLSNSLLGNMKLYLTIFGSMERSVCPPLSVSCLERRVLWNVLRRIWSV